MSRMPYHLVRSARIKSIILGLFGISIIALMMYNFVRGMERGDDRNLFLMLSALAPVYLVLAYMPMQQVMELFDNEIQTYFRVGWTKWNRKKYPRASNQQIIIEQDAERYYCIVLVLAGSPPVLLERYPTYDNAEVRLKQFQEFLAR